jgi:NitT/TauT family transport system substrate-binding protein
MLYLADELGYFREEEIDVQLLELTSLGDVRRNFAMGRADVMACTLIEFLLVAANQDQYPSIIHIADYSKGADVLLASSKYQSIKDLRGARIGFEPSTLDAINLHAALSHAGMSLSDVQLVPVHATDKVEAFQTDKVDAVQCYPPDSLTLAADKHVNKLFDSSEIPKMIVDVLVVDTDWLHANRSRAAALRRAYSRAYDFYASDPDAACEIMARRMGMSIDDFRLAMQGIELVTPAQQDSFFGEAGLLLPALGLTAEAMKSIGMLPGPFNIDRERISACSAGAPLK